MDKARQNFFARAAFTQHEDRYVKASGAFDALPDGLHGLGRAKIDVRRG